MLNQEQISEQVRYWRTSAKRDWETAEALFQNKRRDACLFFCHLAIEKMLKGLVTHRTKSAPPYTHDLVQLAGVAGLIPSPEQRVSLTTIATFNIAGRYDTHKFDFYKKCTPAFTKLHKEKAHTLFVWLEKHFRKQ